jgi:PIN domain nuclease of toxin-antitoxin system
MQVLDAAGNVALVDRETGKDHVCILHLAREILTLAHPASDGAPRYVDKDEWDGQMAAPAPVAPPAAAFPRDDQAKRDTDIAETLDLLDEHDYVKTGLRAGRPKCSAIENIVGYPVFTDEVDAAWDKRAA